MMPPQPTSTMVLIIPLILNTLSAPGPQVRAPKENAPEIVYQIVDQPHVDLSSGSSPGHLPWLPPVDICSRHFGFGNNTDSSILLLLLVSLPGRGDQLARSHGSYMEVNHTIPWTSLPLEPGINGVPRSGEESVCSYPFGLNMSLDVGLFSICDSSLFPPMVGIEERPISDHRVGVPAAFFGVALCRGDGNGSFMESFFRDGRRYTTRELSGYKESVSSAQPRKLLGAHSRNLHNLHRQVLVRKERVVTAAAIAAGSAVLALLCTVAGLLLWCRWKMSDDDERPILQADLFLSGPRRYHYSELAAATHGFSEEGKIGRGGFGPVYRGYLSDQECHVAIKVLSQGSSVQAQGMREFQAEVKIMTRLRHRNIVELLGWCYGSQGLLLVYEFVPNGSLDKHLYDPHRLLSWSDRYKIALDVGSAILYLHTECQQCVLHGDIKPANILLDTSCNAKLGDFGLARLVDHETNSQTTQVVAGTLGYIDPEFVNSQRPSAESDVYSFGVVLLEISCGRRPTSAQSNQTPVLLNWVRRMYSENSILGAADRRLDGEFDDQQMRRVLVGGLWCTHHDQNQRPSIAQAMELLRRQDAELPILPSMHSHGSVRSMEEIAYGGLSAEESSFENSSADTAYHTSKDSTCLLEC